MTPARRVRAGLAALALGAIAAAVPAAAQAAFTKGASGGGDPYFPRAGNGGYDVSRYNLHLRYEPRTNRLVAKAIVHARAEKGLSRFDLDFRHLRVKRVTVNGDRARYSRRGQELKITPRHGLKKGSRFNVRVRYRGHPRPVIDPDGASDGWIRTDDGAFVAAEPQGAPTWFPCNDLLTDKARYRIRVTVPRGKAAISNGELVKSVVHGRNRTFVWEENAPMATYLATVTTGDFDVSRSRANGVPSLVAIDPRESVAAPTLRRLPAMLRLFEPRFGDYPFGATGGTVDHAPNVGYALETQTRPIFDTAPDSRTVAHELAHQWFGDSVSLRRWRQIWLNEGFATWAEWYWVQHNGGETTAQVFNRIYSRHGPNEDSFWNPPPGDPGGPQNLFDSTIYVRGGMTLEALRQEVGTETLFRILDDWTRQHAYANAGTKQFIELAEADSGRDLGRFFHIWLYRSGKPRGWRGTAATHAGRAALEPAGGVMRSIGRLR